MNVFCYHMFLSVEMLTLTLFPINITLTMAFLIHMAMLVNHKIHVIVRMPALFIFAISGPRVYQERILEFENVLHVGSSLAFQELPDEILHLEIQLGVLDTICQLVLTKPTFSSL